MGQYYKPVNLDKKEWLYSHEYGNGLKLMEHSYLGNNFVAAVENLLSLNGPWYGNRIVWAGDYADNEPDIKEENIYSLCNKEGYAKIKPADFKDVALRYLVNLDTMQFVDLAKCPPDPNNDGWVLHPLPLLTCEGNGRGGGDYRGKSRHIGKWARNRIGLLSTLPIEFKEYKPNFKEQ